MERRWGKNGVKIAFVKEKDCIFGWTRSQSNANIMAS
jgi:hypothetical protein